LIHVASHFFALLTRVRSCHCMFLWPPSKTHASLLARYKDQRAFTGIANLLQ